MSARYFRVRKESQRMSKVGQAARSATFTSVSAKNAASAPGASLSGLGDYMAMAMTSLQPSSSLMASGGSGPLPGAGAGLVGMPAAAALKPPPTSFDLSSDGTSEDDAAPAAPQAPMPQANLAPTTAAAAVSGGAAAAAAPAAEPTATQQQAIDGNSTDMPAPDEKAPPSMSAADIEQLNNGLLVNMGNQDLQGKGGMKDLLQQKVQGAGGGAIGTDPDVTWRAYKTALAIKNRACDGNGGAQSSDARLDGKIGGFTSSGDARPHTDAGAMQDYLLHGTVPAPANNISPTPHPGTTAAQQVAVDGETTDLPSSDEQPPPGLTADDIGKLNGGLLDNLGNQNLQGQGNLRDLLAKKYGGVDANSLKTDPAVAWRAYRALTAVKNETNNDGTPKPDGFRHNGNIGGFTPAGEAPHGSEAGSLQDLLLHDRTPSKLQDHPSDQTGANGGSASGAEVAGKEFKRDMKYVGMALGMAAAALIPGVGEVVDAGLGAAIGIGEGAAEAATAAGEAAATAGEAASEAGAAAGEAAGEAGAAAGEATGEAGAASGEAAGEAGAASGEAAGGAGETVATQAESMLNRISPDQISSWIKEAANQGVKLTKDQAKEQLKQYFENWLQSQTNGTQPAPTQQASPHPSVPVSVPITVSA